MSTQQTAKTTVEISVENIGGIDESDLKISAGVSILAGRNATNRTSFLRALMAALGSDNASLKGDSDEGTVEMKYSGETYERTLSRRQGTTLLEGDPYLDNPAYAELFAFLLESNDARQSVERGDDLYDVIMRPVDTEQIDAEIVNLEEERKDLQATLDELDELDQQLPKLEEERIQLQEEIETKKDELEEKRAELDALEIDAEEASEIDNRFRELREERNELENLRQQIEDEKRLVEALREDRDDIEGRLDGLASVDEGELNDLEYEIQRRRNAIESIESTIAELESVLKFNESILEESRLELLQLISDEAANIADDGAVTDQLVDGDEEIVCWTCGSQVERDQVEQTVSILRDVYSEKIDERSTLRDEVDELEADRKHIERTRQERNQLQQELDDIETELDAKTDRMDELESEADELEETVRDLDARVEEIETDEHDERLDLHREINELEFELDRHESQLESVESEITGIEDRLEERTEFQEELESINEEIENLRSRIENLEMEAVDQFNDQMGTILDLLEFDNIERIWIERVKKEVQDGRRKVQKTAFDLHIIRSTDSGSVYEDTVDHLSESERELVGLVFALAGYLVHEVYEQVPFILLDSMEAFDSERLSMLIDYLAEYADYLVVALLPEDAAALDDSYERITEI
jgi:predicted RNase H-like nuclease (RuvC/YqgF family)